MTKTKKESNLTSLKIISLILLIIAPIYGIIDLILRIYLKVNLIYSTYIFLIISIITLILTIIVFIKKKSNVLNIINLIVSILYLATSIILLPFVIFFSLQDQRLTVIPQIELKESKCFLYSEDGILMEYTCDNKEIAIPAKLEETEIKEISPQFFNNGNFETIYILSEKEFEIPEYAFANQYEHQEINIYYRGKINWITKTDDLCKTENNYFTCENEYTDNIITIKSQKITNLANKEVPIKPIIQFTPPYAQAIEEINLNQNTIVINGYEEVIDKIDSINLNITMNGDTYKGTPALPFLVLTNDNINVDVKTNIAVRTTREINNVNIKNLNEEYTATLLTPINSIAIIIEGTENNINNYTESDIEAYIDLNAFQEGIHEVEIKINTNNQYIAAIANERVQIRINKK